MQSLLNVDLAHPAHMQLLVRLGELMCAQDGQVMLLAVGEPEVGGSSAAVEQQEPLLPGQQQKVRLLACCTFMLLLQWQGSAWGVDRGQPLMWQHSGGGSRQLLWEQEPAGNFWRDGQLPDWARYALWPPLYHPLTTHTSHTQHPFS